jgi:hypothetical protein
MATAKAPAKRKAPTRKKVTPRKVTPKVPAAVTHEFTEEQWAALLQTYSTLKAAGLPIPTEVSEPVDAWLAQQKAIEIEVAAVQDAEAEALAQEDAEGPKWIRNLYTSPFSIRLQRQSDMKTRRIELKPRGVRGDMFPLEPGDENDHVLRANIGRIEIIGDGTAKRVAEGQTTNIQKTNTTLAMITNEVGEPITKLTVETEFNQQGVVVGYVDPNQHAKLEKGEFGKSKAPLGDLSRQPEQVQHFVPTGGNPAIVSQGPLTDNARAAVQDTLARIKGRQGRPEDVLGLTVSVEPTRTS